MQSYIINPSQADNRLPRLSMANDEMARTEGGEMLSPRNALSKN